MMSKEILHYALVELENEIAVEKELGHVDVADSLETKYSYWKNMMPNADDANITKRNDNDKQK